MDRVRLSHKIGGFFNELCGVTYFSTYLFEVSQVRKPIVAKARTLGVYFRGTNQYTLRVKAFAPTFHQALQWQGRRLHFDTRDFRLFAYLNSGTMRYTHSTWKLLLLCSSRCWPSPMRSWVSTCIIKRTTQIAFYLPFLVNIDPFPGPVITVQNQTQAIPIEGCSTPFMTLYFKLFVKVSYYNSNCPLLVNRPRHLWLFIPSSEDHHVAL